MAGETNAGSMAQPLGLSFPSAIYSGELGTSHTIPLSLRSSCVREVTFSALGIEPDNVRESTLQAGNPVPKRKMDAPKPTSLCGRRAGSVSRSQH